MEFKLLRIFIEVVQQGNFSKAAEVLFATQSTVSKAIKQLEDELGVTLIERFKRHNVPTAAGEIVYRRGIKLLADRDDLLKELDEIRGLKQGKLRLGISPVGSSTLFAPLFARYRQRYPGIEVELIEHGSDKLAECLRAGTIDFAGTLLPISEEFDCQPVRSEPIVALLARNHPFATRDSISLKELQDTPFILFGSGFALHRLILDACSRVGFQPKVVAQSSQIDFMLELVSSGLGVAFLPRMISAERSNPQIHSLFLDDDMLQWNMAMTWRRNAYLSSAAKAWLALIREVVQISN
ncbi:LysR family transcriptional regulator [Legionella longbeachae]|uniref:Putative transcriptional regulator, lysR family n=1 Tax=Legionella longbeachae serogroup 1 (strain NSW150) TaxID=661367 RepID=D3HMK0_LEGLN|nr:LysR family transcriptional regulator [Legionella longbeachae]VEE04110.1 LysR family transcriptional regulator [Legionella oakridgensis]HBD7396966.1 LysR family transcriptional regulator [Legionella pneumophila]ARB93048.1 LysR family transcriptional regulator [Legionella longbeachae]ARM33890.1 LysR family transcriptional regulator [Legionella longbeachae]EEZ96916.1 LysR family transcriptional regulator [Legionella longbeachae D-4968]